VVNSDRTGCSNLLKAFITVPECGVSVNRESAWATARLRLFI